MGERGVNLFLLSNLFIERNWRILNLNLNGWRVHKLCGKMCARFPFISNNFENRGKCGKWILFVAGIHPFSQSTSLILLIQRKRKIWREGQNRLLRELIAQTQRGRGGTNHCGWVQLNYGAQQNN